MATHGASDEDDPSVEIEFFITVKKNLCPFQVTSRNSKEPNFIKIQFRDAAACKLQFVTPRVYQCGTNSSYTFLELPDTV